MRKDGRAVTRTAAEVRVRAGAPRGVEVIVELDVIEPGRVALEPPSLQGLAGVQAQARGLRARGAEGKVNVEWNKQRNPEQSLPRWSRWRIASCARE